MFEMNYAARFSRSMHFALRLKVGSEVTAFIRYGEKGGRGGKGSKHIYVDRLPNKEFVKRYPTEDVEADLVTVASRLRDKKSLGYILSEEALAHLNHIITKEPLMAKFQQPDTPPVTEQTPNRQPKEPKEPKAPKTPKEPKEPKAEGDRTRRPSFPAEAAITAIGANPARVGTVRHAIVENILKADTVGTALSTVIEKAEGGTYKIGMPDLYFAYERGLISIAGVPSYVAPEKVERAAEPTTEGEVIPGAETAVEAATDGQSESTTAE